MFEAIFGRLKYMATRSRIFGKKHFLPFLKWVGGILLCMVLAVPFKWTNQPEATVWLRAFGMWLQILGVLIIIYGIAQSRQLFGKPGFWGSIAEVFADFRLIFIKPTMHNASAIVNAPTITVHGGIGSVSVNPTLEERVKRLEERSDKFDKEIGRIDARAADIESKIAKERSERRSENRRIFDQIETVAIGSATLQLGGALYILFGVILTSIPAEIKLQLPWLP